MNQQTSQRAHHHVPQGQSIDSLSHNGVLLAQSQSPEASPKPAELHPGGVRKQQTLTQRVVVVFRDDVGQATVEYALVMLGAAAVAGMLLAWAVSSGVIEELMTTIINSVLSDATSPAP